MSRPKRRWVDADDLLLGRDGSPAEHPKPGEFLARLWHTRIDERGRLAGWRMSVETEDGRSLVADLPGFEDGRTAPLVELDASPELRDLLDEAWRDLPRMGRPPGLTTIVEDGQIHAVIAQLRRDRRRVTQETVRASGGWTIHELRGYLRAHRKAWRRDFLDT